MKSLEGLTVQKVERFELTLEGMKAFSEAWNRSAMDVLDDMDRWARETLEEAGLPTERVQTKHGRIVSNPSWLVTDRPEPGIGVHDPSWFVRKRPHTPEWFAAHLLLHVRDARDAFAEKKILQFGNAVMRATALYELYKFKASLEKDTLRGKKGVRGAGAGGRKRAAERREQIAPDHAEWRRLADDYRQKKPQESQRWRSIQIGRDTNAKAETVRTFLKQEKL